MPIGPEIKISTQQNPDGWNTASCFEGNIPVMLNGMIEPGYHDFGKPNYISASYTNPAFQWASIEGPNIACPGDAILFRDTSIGQIVNWHWNFGNGNTSDLQNPDIQYYPVTDGSFFPVILTVTDTAGCVQTGKKFY